VTAAAHADVVAERLWRLRDHYGYFTREELYAAGIPRAPGPPPPVPQPLDSWPECTARDLGPGCDHDGPHCPAWQARTGAP
jgi:hypothetical protein